MDHKNQKRKIKNNTVYNLKKKAHTHKKLKRDVKTSKH